MKRIAINGFGRIGRNLLRTILGDERARKALDVVAINLGPAKRDSAAHMFKYDTLMGTYSGDVTLENHHLKVGGYKINLLTETDPLQCKWGSLNIDWVIDCSGRFTQRKDAQLHLDSGAKKVLISAPAKDEDITIIPGVNDAAYKPDEHNIVSLGSCTTNAFVTMVKVLHDEFTIERSFMTTVHAYTNTQVLLDVEHKDLRRARAAALNIIPTTTGAMKVMGKILPDLIGCVEAVALRVPVGKISLIDLSFISKKLVSMESMNAAFERASKDSMPGILGISYEPLVSCDYFGDSHSVVIDGLLTATCGQRMGKVFGWYDNEWGYSARLRDFVIDS